MPPPLNHFKIGQTIGSGSFRYRVEALVTSSQIGPVYLARDLHRDQVYSLQVLPGYLATDSEALTAVRERVDRAAGLAHPHILPVFSLEMSGEQAYLVSQYLPGGSLLDRLEGQPHQPLSTIDALVILKALCSALVYAHSRGLVHGGLHPEHIWMAEDGGVYLSGLGLPRDLVGKSREGDEDLHITQYQAPEQFTQGKFPAGETTDVYALGVLLYEILTRQHPFPAISSNQDSGSDSARAQVIRGILRQRPTDPSYLNPDLSLELAQVILRAMEKYPGDRFPSPHSLFAAACRALDVDPDSVPDRFGNNLDQTRPIASEGKDQSGVGWREWLQKRRWFVAGGVVFLILLVILAGYLFSLFGNERLSPALLTASSQQDPEPGTTEPPGPTMTAGLETAAPIPSPGTLATDPSGNWFNPADGAVLVRVEDGEFTMGSDRDSDPYLWGAEQPVHTVNLDEFWIYREEVTNRLYRDCVIEGACPVPAGYDSSQRKGYFDEPHYDHYPVVNVTWAGASAYCTWVGGRLPTEAEWEKAARGMDGRLFAWGNDHSAGDQANFCDSRCLEDTRNPDLDDGYSDTAPVGSYPAGASPYGALDLSGNVWEWVHDWFDPLYYPVSPRENPQGPDKGERHVIRGGSFFNPTDGIRVVARASLKPEDAKVTVGFRCVLEP